MAKKKHDRSGVRHISLEAFLKKMTTGEIRQGPIRRTRFPPEMAAAIHDVYHRVGRYHISSYEAFELGFCRDTNPQQEIAIWQLIAKAAEIYWAERPTADRQETVMTLCLLSMGASLGGRLQAIWSSVLTGGDRSRQ
jgi:hypothetical protein